MLTDAIRGPRLPVLNELTRGYVRAAPGRLDKTSYDHRTGPLSASGVAPVQKRGRRLDELVAFYPRHKHGGMRVKVHGLRRPRIVRAPGGGRLIAAKPRGGPWSIAVTSRARKTTRRKRSPRVGR